MENRVFNNIDVIELTKKMVTFDTYVTKGKAEILNYIKGILSTETSAEINIYNEDKENPYLIAHLKSKSPEFTLMLEGHVDVVSPEGMVVEPFNPHENGDILTGRGVTDMKSGCAAMLTAFVAASKSTERKGDIYLVYTTDEEYAGAEVIEIMEKKLIPNCDFVMIAEPTDEVLCTAHKGNAWVDVEFFGKSAHASTPELGINSIYMASEFICRYKKYTDELYAKQEDEIHGKPTLNVGVINGGTEPNIVPAYTKVRLDKRYLPGDNIENFIKEIEIVTEECKKENPEFNSKINIVVDCSAVILDRNNDILKEVRTAIGEKCELGVFPGWGEGGYINKYGLPVVYFGPGDVKYAHTKDEQCSISQIIRVTEAYYNVIKKLCLK